MSVWSIDTTCDDFGLIESALKIAMGDGKATHYKVLRIFKQETFGSFDAKVGHKENCDGVEGKKVYSVKNLIEDKNGQLTIVFYSNEICGAIPLPYPMKVADMVDFAKGWLKNAADYGEYPDTDGSARKAWRVFIPEEYNDFFGYGVFCLQGVYIIYGK